ncbi:PREDICTED: uncharacterized protein LOC109462381 [Branchiostoma belcheri]|uniref:Uncharacterized protein LOC109462381 n=1 Tax=Branchiostoma belcheri TaxID=7741 RepID=A0A6P4Y6W1_BRABE|nr:PREDICTED: uncharacterized protein LOC109462381 [Branchiostoma belcheri]
MPYILVRANFNVPQEFDAKLSKLMSEISKMHEGYILSELRVNKRLLLGGSGEKCVYSDVRLADVLLSNEGDKEKWSKGIQDFLVGELGVKPGRCIMSITPIPLNVGSIEGRPVSEWVPPPDWYGGY